MSDLIAKADAFAELKHRGQTRKDAARSPYIDHPRALRAILQDEGGVREPAILAAALLHDVLEDCVGVAPEDPGFDVTKTALEAEIGAAFGAEVLGLVRELTDDKKLPKDQRKEAQVRHAGHASPGAKLIKLADKIANLRDIRRAPPADWSPQRRQAYFDWAKRVVDQVRGVHAGLEQAFDRIHQQGAQPGL